MGYKDNIGDLPTPMFAEAKLLADMFARSDHIVKPKPENIAAIDDANGVEIALISRTIRFGAYDISNAELFKRAEFLQGLRFKNEHIEELRATFKKDIESACADGKRAKIVCFGEGAFPWEHVKDEDLAERSVRPGSKIKKAERVLLNEVATRNNAFVKDVQKLADDLNVLIIAGSSHDSSCKNVARVFSPGQGTPFETFKLSSATSMGERLRPRESVEFAMFDTGKFYIVVLICIDALVPTTAIRCAMMAVFNDVEARKKKPVKYIFVPSLNNKGSDPTWGACKALSSLSNCVVAYVNCQIQEPHFGIFIGGFCACPSELADIPSLVKEDIPVATAGDKGVLYRLPADVVRAFQACNPVKESKILRLAVSGLKNEVRIGRGDN